MFSLLFKSATSGHYIKSAVVNNGSPSIILTISETTTASNVLNSLAFAVQTAKKTPLDASPFKFKSSEKKNNTGTNITLTGDLEQALFTLTKNRYILVSDANRLLKELNISKKYVEQNNNVYSVPSTPPDTPAPTSSLQITSLSP